MSTTSDSPSPSSSAESELPAPPLFPSTPKHPSLEPQNTKIMSQPPFPVSDVNVPPPVWPRRASKACASCRRDKIRCDGARPCSGCTKKGYTADQCIDGCEHCRRARVRCEGGKPCRRCREMQLECVDESATPLSRQESSSSVGRSMRAATSDRAKLACQNCRRDNKKCDNQRPCSRCVARSEECVHVGRGPKLVKLRCEGCRLENKRCEDNRPCKQCVELGRQCINLPRKGRGHGTRVKAACTNCRKVFFSIVKGVFTNPNTDRRDKIRCDGSRPCATCSRKGYECVDRACRACTRNGKEAECTHHKSQDAGGSDHGDDQVGMGFNEQSSHTQPIASSSSTQLHHLHPHPPSTSYGPLSPMNQYYYPLPPPSMGSAQPSSMMPNPSYAPLRRSPYYPVIDPNIDNPPRSPSDPHPPSSKRTS